MPRPRKRIKSDSPTRFFSSSSNPTIHPIFLTMRFFATALAVLGVASAYTPTTNPAKGLVERQAVVAGTGCALVDVDLPRNVDALCELDLLSAACSATVTGRLLRGTLNTIISTTFLAVGNPLLT